MVRSLIRSSGAVPVAEAAACAGGCFRATIWFVGVSLSLDLAVLPKKISQLQNLPAQFTSNIFILLFLQVVAYRSF